MKHLRQITSSLARNVYNIPGWCTSRKILVIESDDWGAVRMSSRAAYESLLGRGIRVDRSPFCRYDSLASEEDLSRLFEVLTSHKGRDGNPAVITANCVMANPDFDRIRESEFSEYHYEVFTDTLARYPRHAGAFDLWKEGIRAGVFFPQLHGREHVNIGRWLGALRRGSREAMQAFDHGVYGIDTTTSAEPQGNYMAALDFESVADAGAEEQFVADAARLFREQFGFASRTFIAPNYIWSGHTERYLQKVGVQGVQSGRKQIEPTYLGSRRRWRYTGQRNLSGQMYTVRNCIFEPSTGNPSSLANCIKQIEASFRWGKPAIVASHRLNYIGFIEPRNRDANLDLLNDLLGTVVRRWPEVEFMTTVQLHDQLSDSEVNDDQECGIQREVASA